MILAIGLSACGDDPIKKVKKSPQKGAKTYEQYVNEVNCLKNSESWQILSENKQTATVTFSCMLNEHQVLLAQTDLNALLQSQYQKQEEMHQRQLARLTRNQQYNLTYQAESRKRVHKIIELCERCQIDFQDKNIDKMLDNWVRIYLEKNRKESFYKIVPTSISSKFAGNRMFLMLALRDLGEYTNSIRENAHTIEEVQKNAPKLEKATIEHINYLLTIHLKQGALTQSDETLTFSSQEKLPTQFSANIALAIQKYARTIQ